MQAMKMPLSIYVNLPWASTRNLRLTFIESHGIQKEFQESFMELHRRHGHLTKLFQIPLSFHGRPSVKLFIEFHAASTISMQAPLTRLRTSMKFHERSMTFHGK